MGAMDGGGDVEVKGVGGGELAAGEVDINGGWMRGVAGISGAGEVMAKSLSQNKFQSVWSQNGFLEGSPLGWSEEM